MIVLNHILDALEHFVKVKMTKQAKRRCCRFFSDDTQLILYTISEYNCYEARRGTNHFITFNFHSGYRGEMHLIINASDLRLSDSDKYEIASEVKKWLIEFYEQERAIEEQKQYEQFENNRT